jgi:hypothetical protein
MKHGAGDKGPLNLTSEWPFTHERSQITVSNGMVESHKAAIVRNSPPDRHILKLHPADSVELSNSSPVSYAHSRLRYCQNVSFLTFYCCRANSRGSRATASGGCGRWLRESPGWATFPSRDRPRRASLTTRPLCASVRAGVVRSCKSYTVELFFSKKSDGIRQDHSLSGG